MQTYTKIASRTNISSAHHDFEVCDRLKRKIGCQINIGTTEFAAQDEGLTYGYAFPIGKKITLHTQATRNGEGYGASQPTQYFDTSAEATEAAAKYLVAARKRAIKREGK